MLGLYGLLAFVIRWRTREVGNRMALGALKKDVMLLVVRQGSLLVVLGGIRSCSRACNESRCGNALWRFWSRPLYLQRRLSLTRLRGAS